MSFWVPCLSVSDEVFVMCHFGIVSLLLNDIKGCLFCWVPFVLGSIMWVRKQVLPKCFCFSFSYELMSRLYSYWKRHHFHTAIGTQIWCKGSLFIRGNNNLVFCVSIYENYLCLLGIYLIMVSFI